MEDFFWHLRTPDLFEGLPAEVKKAFFDKASLRILRKKEYVFKENEPVFSCFYLKKGIVRIFRVSKNGKEAVLFIHNDGALFGLAEIINNKTRKSNAQALSPCQIYSIAREDFEELLEHNPCLSRRIIDTLGSRVRYLGEKLESLMVDSVPVRLIKMLLCLSVEAIYKSQKPVNVPFSLSQYDFATMTGSCQQTVSEILKKLTKDGFIRVEGRRIILLEPEKLFKLFYGSN